MNYQHLLYFKAVATHGGITAAAQRLRLTPPTLSAQIRTFEESLGVALFERSARGMNLTEAGRVALRYAERIFTLGNELQEALPGEQPRLTRVGVETSMVAATVRPILVRLAATTDNVRIVCSFAAHDELVASLKTHDLDIVLTTAPLAASPLDDFVSRAVDEAELGFFGNAKAAHELSPGFPASLDGASFIAPPRTHLREAVERWLAQAGIELLVNIEIGDASVAAALATDGVGILAAPLSAEVELEKRYDLRRIGVAHGVHARIHAIGSPSAIEGLLSPLDGEGEADAPTTRDETSRLRATR